MSKNRPYANAKFALPKEIYLQAKKYLEGHLVWFPQENNENLESRDQYVVRLREEGFTVAHIAEELCVTPRQVWRILEKHQAKRQSS